MFNRDSAPSGQYVLDLVAQILPLLEGAELNRPPIPDSTASNLIQQAQNLLPTVKEYAGSL
jgi:hypothetical protein